MEALPRALQRLRKLLGRARRRFALDTFDVFGRRVTDEDAEFRAPDGYVFRWGDPEDVLEADVVHTELDAEERAIFSRQVGQPLRERQQVKVVEETADTVYLIAPYVGPEIGAELTDAELEQVCGGSKKGGGGGGGGGGTYYICNNNVGVGTRVEISTDVSLF